jgi:hypothetical protein
MIVPQSGPERLPMAAYPPPRLGKAQAGAAALKAVTV